MKAKINRMSGIILYSIVILIIFGGAARAQQVPAGILLGDVERTANQVYRYSHNFADQEFTRTNQLGSESYVKLLFDGSKDCLAAIDKAVAAGVPETRTVNVKRQADNSNLPMSLAEIREMCRRVLKMTGGAMWKGQAAEAAQYISIWLKPLQDGSIDKTQAAVAAQNGKEALAKLDEARSGGLADTDELEVLGQTMTVRDAREQIVYIQTEISKINDKFVAEEEAKYAPFRAALTGDKLDLYNSRMKHSGVYGAGGRMLKTPAEYAASPVWCEWSVDRNSLITTWELGCWHFKGMTKVGAVVTRSGVGATPPSSAFR
ncbi:MAG: hypothetical protein JSS81_23000 [Acidobacteria bacterium]|nr:hypothetical protein [Acidobacteriota bacterium]